MNRMTKSLLIIRALRAHVDRLREMLGDEWPEFSVQVQALARTVEGAERNQILFIINQLVALGLKSPAAGLVREILREVQAQGAEAAPALRSARAESATERPPENLDRAVVVAAIHDLAESVGDRPPLVARRANGDDQGNDGQGNPGPVTFPNPGGQGAGPTAVAGQENAPQGPEPVPAAERRISIWLSDHPEGLSERLPVDEAYTLNFKVGRPVEGNLVGGAATEVPASDVPAGGLITEWVVTSRTVELTAGTSETTVATTSLEGVMMWIARFPLLIPEEGDSAVPQLKITPRTPEAAQLEVLVYARREIYRQFTVRLAVESPAAAGAAVASIQDEFLHVPTAHLNLQTTHEWTTPPGELSVTVMGSMAAVRGDVGPQYVSEITPWSGVPALVAGKVENVRSAAERFRARWEAYLNDIDPDDLASRLQQWTPEYDWAAPRDHADARHQQRWDDGVRASQELRDMAFEGHRLYDTFFPAGSDLRSWMDALGPGHRLDVSWTPQSGPGWIPHVPWGLMYLPDAPAPGQLVDPIGFLALRFRLGYMAHAVRAGSKALGSVEETHRAHFLYWGDKPEDIAGEESRWQRRQWAPWKNQVFFPTDPRAPNPKAEVLRMLDEPTPTPTSVLYLFCHCNVGDGTDPVLRFGGTAQVADVLRRTELGTKLLADRPLVFANACATAATDPYMANELEDGFFARGCRAYLGTETKVPIQFASRFASIFFHFFYRIVDPAPMAAGEAVAQARLFLWTHYRNLGGLFYTYVNQYELFMARDAEVLTLRA